MNLIIISHRRSGTHLTIDSILNNFSYFDKSGRGYELIDFYSKSSININKLLTLDRRIIKTHILPNFKIYGLDDKNRKILTDFFAKTHKIYVYRNGLDVMISLYHYMQSYDENIKNLSFKQFLTTTHNFDPIEKPMDRSRFWAYHIEQWQQYLKDDKKTLWLKYEDWMEDYEHTLDKISDFLSLPKNKKTIDIRIKHSMDWHNDKILKLYYDIKKKIYALIGRKFTAVLPRKAQKEQFYEYFDSSTLKLIHPAAIDMMEELGYKVTI